MSETVTPGRVMIEGGLDGARFSGFPEGVDSFSHPLAVKQTQVRWMENGVTQGAFLQTRPGYKTALTFDVNTPGTPYNIWWNNGSKGNLKVVTAKRTGTLTKVGTPGLDGVGTYRTRTVSGTMQVSEYVEGGCSSPYPGSGTQTGTMSVFYFFNTCYEFSVSVELVGVDSSNGNCTYKFLGHQILGGITLPTCPAGGMPPPYNYALLAGYGAISPGYTWIAAAGTTFTIAIYMQQISGYGVGAVNYTAGNSTFTDTWDQVQEAQNDGSFVYTTNITNRTYPWGAVSSPISSSPYVSGGRPDLLYQQACTIVWPIQPVYTQTTTTNTSRTTTGLGCVPGLLPWEGGGPGSMEAIGTVTQILSDEDTREDSIDRFDEDTPWSSWVETVDYTTITTYGDDDGYTEAKMQVQLTNLTPGRSYRVLIIINRRNISTGNSEYYQTVDLVGVANTLGQANFDYTLQNAEGFEFFVAANGVSYEPVDTSGSGGTEAPRRPTIHPQMMVDFVASNGQVQKVFAVSGSVWYCPINPNGTLGEAQQIKTLQFSEYADQLTGTLCTQTNTIVAGQYVNNIVPRNLLIIQDGINRAGIWDGQVGVHMNPEKKVETDSDGNTLYPSNYNQTRIGLWCAWSGDRLFVFNGRLGFASDLGDPTHFTEELSLNSFQVMVFPENVTGAIDRGTSGNNQSAVIVCTRTTTWTLFSGVRARIPSTYSAGWANTPGFMTKIFSGVGCIAGKSMTVHRGLLYWKSLDGIVVFDSVNTVNSTQNLPIIDKEMVYSKRLICPPNNPAGDLTCVGKRDSYVFWSVPVGPVTNGRCYCRHTQVLDLQTTAANTAGWQGVWTGMRPVEWSSIELASEYTYALSMDADGVVRIWQAFQSNRADNGKPIDWLVETRLDRVQNSVFEYANFRHFRLLVDQVLGNFDIKGYWRGMRGSYHELLNQRITATPGSILTPVPGFSEIVNTTPQYAFLPQTRTVISQDLRGVNTVCSSAGVESQYEDGTDHAFSLLLKLRGRGAIVAYRIAVDSRPDNTEGTAVNNTGVDENGFNIISAAECPQHIDGVTPDYDLYDQPIQLALSPYQPVFDESSNYQSPTS